MHDVVHKQDTHDVGCAFIVRQPGFTGTLGELAHALHSNRLRPQDVDLLQLVKSYLAHYAQLVKTDMEIATDTLPQVARVIEVKTRLLLPRPPKVQDEQDEPEQDASAVEAVLVLARLDQAVRFLRVRREDRHVVLPARAPGPSYPRRFRPLTVSVVRLAEMAGRFSRGNYFELAAPRLSVDSASAHLWQKLKRCGRALLTDLLPSRSWEGLVMSFAGMLELVREGKLRARQARPFGAIEVELERDQVRDVA